MLPSCIFLFIYNYFFSWYHFKLSLISESSYPPHEKKKKLMSPLMLHGLCFGVPFGPLPEDLSFLGISCGSLPFLFAIPAICQINPMCVCDPFACQRIPRACYGVTVYGVSVGVPV